MFVLTVKYSLTGMPKKFFFEHSCKENGLGFTEAVPSKLNSLNYFRFNYLTITLTTWVCTPLDNVSAYMPPAMFSVFKTTSF